MIVVAVAAAAGGRGGWWVRGCTEGPLLAWVGLGLGLEKEGPGKKAVDSRNEDLGSDELSLAKMGQGGTNRPC